MDDDELLGQAATLIEMGFHWMVLCVTVKGEEICHIVGYPEQPADYDMHELIKELATDPEFGMKHLVYQRDYQTYIGKCEDLINAGDELHKAGES